MAENKVVVRMKDGGLHKGTTKDFFPNKEKFHLEHEGGEMSQIMVAEIKALFFVRDFGGTPELTERYEDEIAGGGRKVEVTFEDGEVIVGFTTAYSKTRPGWFLLPANKQSNNLRIYVANSAVQSVRMLD